MKWFMNSLMMLMLAANFSLMTGCSVNPVTGQKQLVLISKEQEIAIGQQSAPQFEKEFEGLHANAALQAYVQQVGKKVASHSDRDMPYEFALLKSSIPNAFALPGGKVYVTAGLFQIMDNERQLAGVLGHEIGHIAAMHSVNMLQRQVGMEVLLAAAGYAAKDKNYQPAVQAGAEVALGMVSLRYSRDDEYQADKTGIKYMERAGYNPWGMIDLLESLLKLNEQEPGRLEELFMTHPLTSKRINEAKAIITNKYPGSTPDDAAGNAEFTRMHTLLGTVSK